MVFGMRSIGVFSQFFVGSLLRTTIVVHDATITLLSATKNIIALKV